PSRVFLQKGRGLAAPLQRVARVQLHHHVLAGTAEEDVPRQLPVQRLKLKVVVVVAHPHAVGLHLLRQLVGSNAVCPQREPVPTIPGPIITTAPAAPSTERAATRPLAGWTASRSPPKACPQVTTPASRPCSRKRAAERLRKAGRAAPSVIT